MRRVRTSSSAGVAAVIGCLSVVGPWAIPFGTGLGATAGPIHPAPGESPIRLAGDIEPLSSQPWASGQGPLLSLTATGSSDAVCAYGTPLCPAGTATDRLTLSAQALGPPTGNWSAVQMLFVLGLSPYAVGPSACWDYCRGNLNSNISSADPYFLSHAGAIARSIAAAHPGVNLTFGLVGTFGAPGAGNGTDDGDNPVYVAGVGDFANASSFGRAVNGSTSATWYALDVDFGDNPLQSDSISAIYAALSGWNVSWSNATHHVLVWIGVTAPLDPAYPEKLCGLLGPNLYGYGCGQTNCEPAYSFANYASVPRCERWVNASSSNPNASSLAVAAFNGSSCQESLGGYCTIDSVILNATPTNPRSPAWNVANASDRAAVANDTRSIVQSGCDLANATAGTWDGPYGDQCAALGTWGTLNYSGTTENFTPGLTSALVGAGLGAPLPNSYFARGGSYPMFQFVLPDNVSLPSDPNASTSCSHSNGTQVACPSLPQVHASGGTTILGWNWSNTPSSNWLQPGDRWSVSFNASINRSWVPYAIPMDVCDTALCLAAGAGPSRGGAVSEARVLAGPSGALIAVPFPLLTVRLLPPNPLGGQLAASPPYGVAPLSVTLRFVASGGVPPLEYFWKFGDGTATSSSSAVLTHAYNQSGAFAAYVRATDATGGNLWASRLVQVYAPLRVAVEASPINGTVPLVVTFQALPSGGEAPYTVVWQPGTGDNFSSSEIVVDYVQPGTYRAVARVSDASGQTASQMIAIVAGAVRPLPLAATAVLTHLSTIAAGCGPGAGVASLEASASGGTPPYQFDWKFGDGGTATGASVNHTYLHPGSWNVTATVTDAAGSETATALYVGVPQNVAGCVTPSTGALSFWPLVSFAGAIGGGAAAILFVVRRPLRPRSPPDRRRT